MVCAGKWQHSQKEFECCTAAVWCCTAAAGSRSRQHCIVKSHPAMVCYVFGILVTEGALLELVYTPQHCINWFLFD